MPNMSYCRMENTYADLKDCYDNWDDVNSSSEKKYQAKILKLCARIVEAFDEENVILTNNLHSELIQKAAQ